MSHFNFGGAAIAGTILVALGSFNSAIAAEKVLKIGAPLPLTGPLAPDGQRLKAGYDLWAEAQNAAGGIKAGPDTYKVEIIYSDYQSNTPRAVQSTERMITEDQIDAVFNDRNRREQESDADENIDQGETSPECHNHARQGNEHIAVLHCREPADGRQQHHEGQRATKTDHQ